MGKMVRKPGPARANFDKAMSDLPNLVAKIGWFATSTYDDEQSTPVAYIAAIQDNGVASQSIPPRPFFKPTKDREQSNWSALMAGATRRVLKGDMTARGALELIGLQAAADTQKTITMITTPPLSILTLMARKHKQEGGKVTGATIGEFAQRLKNGETPDLSGVSTKPLNETGRMLATLTSVVEEK